MLYYNKNIVQKAQIGVEGVTTQNNNVVIDNTTAVRPIVRRQPSRADLSNLAAKYDESIVGRRKKVRNPIGVPDDLKFTTDDRRYAVYNIAPPKNIIDKIEDPFGIQDYTSRVANKGRNRVSDLLFNMPSGVINLNEGTTRYIRTNEALDGGNVIMGGTMIPNLYGEGKDKQERGRFFNSIENFRKNPPANEGIYYGADISGKYIIGGLDAFPPGTYVGHTARGNQGSYDLATLRDTGFLSPAALRLYGKAQSVKDAISGAKVGAQPGQQTFITGVENGGGKILVYSPSTGDKQFVYGTVASIVKDMNLFKDAYPDANFIKLDNGAFSQVIGKEGYTLDRNDYNNYWRGDELYENNLGGTFIYTYPKD